MVYDNGPNMTALYPRKQYPSRLPGRSINTYLQHVRNQKAANAGKAAEVSEFRDVVFEDVVFDNNRFYFILYLDFA